MVTLLRTEHIGMRQYLTKRRVPGFTPDCECGQGHETPKHVCIFCPKWKERRHLLFKEGGSTNWKDLANTKRGLHATAKWLIQEGVLEQFALAGKEG